MIYLYALVSTALEIYGDYLFKLGWYGRGSIAYLVGVAPWFLILKNTDLSKAIVVFTSLNVIGCVGVGWGFLGEGLSFRQVIGVGFCLVGVWLNK